MVTRMNAMNNKSRILFHPSNHIWLRTNPFTKSGIKSYRFLEIGITARGLDDIGDVTSIHRPKFCNNIHNNKSHYRRGEELLQIHFDGYSVTCADELYHSVWESYSDSISVQSPVSGKIVDTKKADIIFKFLQRDGIDEETVLIEMMTTEEEWKIFCLQNCFVNRKEYLKIIQKIPQGTFYDE